VIPIDNSRLGTNGCFHAAQPDPRPVGLYLLPGQTRIPEGAAPDTKNKSFKIAADVIIPGRWRRGMIATPRRAIQWLGSLPCSASKPVFPLQPCRCAAHLHRRKEKLSPGEHVIVVEFAYDGGRHRQGGDRQITRGTHKPVAEGRVERTIAHPGSAIDETLDIGEDTGTPVSETTRSRSSSPAT